MKTLTVICLVKLLSGQVVELLGQEIVHMSKTDKIMVQFKSHIAYISENMCTYLENPEIVSKRPELFFKKFQPQCGPVADRLWRTTSLLTYEQACTLAKRMKK